MIYYNFYSTDLLKKISLLILSFVLMLLFDLVPQNTVSAQTVYPYEKTFTITAYYSPLPCQHSYVTGSYEGDIRLNGRGTNGADGTEVYPGMLAGPKVYEFGTKISIPGLGIGSIHDRGGAIVSSNGNDGVYDRLDIWLGYGDKGLERALNWGRRTVTTTVYGPNSTVSDSISLSNYSSSESIPLECSIPDEKKDSFVVQPVAQSVAPVESVSVGSSNKTLNLTLSKGNSGDAVVKLQKELKRLNFYKGEITGIYDDVTEHTVFKFQQSQLLVLDKNSLGAGIFGPKTREKLNGIIAMREDTNIMIANANSREYKFEDEKYLAVEMDLGMVSEDVTKLQLFLKEQGYFDGVIVTNYFGPVTQESLIKFQIENNIIADYESKGAGRVGPSTLKLINEIS